MQQHVAIPSSLSLSAKDAHVFLKKYCNPTPVQPLPATCVHIHFPCGDRLVDYLRTHAKSSKTSKHYDVFYDDSEMTLVKSNSWLRFRDQERFSMKDQIKQDINESSLEESWVRFHEITDEQTILTKVKQLLNYQEPKRRRSKKPLTPMDVAWMPLANFAFVRNEYDTEYGTIYIDEMALSYKCDDFYVLGTIKIYNAKDIPQALAFLKAMELDSGPIRSKAMEWLFVREPETYKKLVESGIVKDIPYQSSIGHYTSPPISKDLDWFKNYAFILEYGAVPEDAKNSSTL